MYIYIFAAPALIPPGLTKALPTGGVVLSFPPSSFDSFYQNRSKMLAKSTTKGTNLAHGRSKGYPKVNKNMNKLKKRKRKEPTYEKTFVFETWGDLLKNRRAQRLLVYCGIMKKVIKMLYKT